jgi:hypothetical protein
MESCTLHGSGQLNLTGSNTHNGYMDGRVRPRERRDAFFPQQPVPENPDPLPLGPPLHVPSLTLYKVKQAIYNAKPCKAPGVDDLPFLVWQKLWLVVRLYICQLYEALLRLRHVPRQWKC